MAGPVRYVRLRREAPSHGELYGHPRVLEVDSGCELTDTRIVLLCRLAQGTVREPDPASMRCLKLERGIWEGKFGVFMMLKNCRESRNSLLRER